jgi:lysophospholipase L1-like esterase
MKSVLVYGDSQTWGRLPGVPERFPFEQRWTSVMAAALGSDVHVIVQGLNGRTTARTDPWKPYRNGLEHFDLQLITHAPLDLVIIALGSNDLQWHQHLEAFESALGAECLIERVVNYRGDPPSAPPPKVMLLGPPRITEPAGLLADRFREAGRKTDDQLRYYRELADRLGIPYMAMADVAQPSPIDGVHLDAAGQRALGLAMAPKVAAILGLPASSGVG